MTHINKSELTQNPRATDNLTAIEPLRPRSVISAGLDRSSQKSQFAEHLTASQPKAGLVAQAPRASAPLKTRPVQQEEALSRTFNRSQPEQTAPRTPNKFPQEQATPRPPSRSQPRRSDTEPTQAPWNRTAVPTRLADDRSTLTPGSSRMNETRLTSAVGSKQSTKSLDQDLSYATAPAPGDGQETAALMMAPVPGGLLTPQGSPSADLEDWQLRLQELLATGNPELFMQQSPALALLAGRLEFVEAAEIPALVAQSPLLQSILSQTQSSDALQVARPLNANLQLLGLAPSAKNSRPIAGLLGNEPPLVTLGETLEALGFDTRRIMQEGDLLKENLSLEGLQNYMQRAERLQSSLGLPVVWPTLPPEAALLSAAQKSGATALDPALMAQLARLAPPTQNSLDSVPLWPQNPERPLAVLDDGRSPLFMDAPAAGWDPFAVPLELKADSALSMPPTMDEVPLVMNTLPRVPTAALDPFTAMAERWNTDNLQTLRPEDFLNQESLEFASEPRTAAAQPLRSLDELLNSQFIQAPDFNSRMEATFFSESEGNTLDLNTLQLSLQEGSTGSDDSGGDFSGRQSNQSFLNQDSSTMPAPGQGPSASNKAFSIETAASQAPSAPVSHQQLQDILDKSSMLIKDGGGSIRLDLGSQEMGPLDLALDIKDKTVELRIIAHSDQAREALVQELPRLRESLQNQNLNLEKVEIGLSYGSAWSQSGGNGQQNREQFFESRSESSSRGPGGMRGSSRSYRQSVVTAPEARVPLHNGLIQVRV